MKKYLGDGVYVEYVDGRIVLTAENGVTITSEIYLDLHVIDNLVEWVKRQKIGF